MSGRAWPAPVALAVALAAAPAGAAEWSEVFAAESDTVVFIGAGTELWRAPFHLATRETLWNPSPGERVARLRVSPDRRRVAWLTRVQDTDTTRLWLYGGGRSRLAARFFSLQPLLRGAPNFEPVVPSIQDEVVDGARLISPNPTMLRRSSNTLAWTPEGSAVVFGYDGGLATISADSVAALEVSSVLVTDMLLLDPAPVYLADVTVVTGGLEIGAYLVYPTRERWRFFRASGLGLASRWSADFATIWWASGRDLRAVRAHDPTPTVEARESEDLVWLEAQPERRTIAWAADRRLARKPVDGGDAERVLETTKPITAVLGGPRGRWRAAVAGDSLHLWDRLDDALTAVPLGKVEPVALFESPDGALALAAEGDGAPRLLLVDRAARALVDTQPPRVRGGRFYPSPSGARLILADPAAAPPRKLQVYDFAGARWVEVSNPGLAGWERLGP